MKFSRYVLFLLFIAAVSLDLPAFALAQEPDEAVIESITTASCLSVGADNPASSAGEGVWIEWAGQAKAARLVLRVAGAEAQHTITLNGQPVATAPLSSGGEPCGGPEFSLPVPLDAIHRGENIIEITNDALPGDAWTAAEVRLEVVTDYQPAVEPAPEVGIAASFTQLETVTFSSSYDGASQKFIAQIPSGGFSECATLSPLVIYVHGRSSSMAEPYYELTSGSSTFNLVVRSKGWLMAAPEMHGSWPGPSPSPPDPPGKYAYASLESQSDIIDTVKYMIEHCNVNTSRIYLYGSSMGGQTSLVTAAKYPHIFAALFDNKGPSDTTDWYNDGAGGSFHRDWMERECHIGGDPKSPNENGNPFCYQRRSGINFARNYFHVPTSITHSEADQLVKIYHSFDMRDAINSYSPDYPASVFVDTVVGPTCDDGGRYHCYEPDTNTVLAFFEQYTLNNHPSHIKIKSDESKPFYWLNVAQSGGDHWSEVEASYSVSTKTVAVNVTDSNALTLGFNLGSNFQVEVLPIPGMGLPSTTYLVKGGGLNTLKDYTGSGYLTANLTSTGSYQVTISALKLTLSADDVVVGNQIISSLTAVVKDQLGNFAPNGTTVTFTTDQGTFSNGQKTFSKSISGGQGQATATLTTVQAANVQATTRLVSNSVVVDGSSNNSEEGQVYLPLVRK